MTPPGVDDDAPFARPQHPADLPGRSGPSRGHAPLSRARKLNDYMQTFLEPLISSVFGPEAVQAADSRSLIQLIQNPDQQVARDNLMKLAQALGVEYTEIPRFLLDYGDVYLSLAYYQYCLDRIKPGLQNFFESLEMIRNSQHLRTNVMLTELCKKVEEKFQAVFAEVDSVFDIFRAITDDMWVDISSEHFRAVEHTNPLYPDTWPRRASSAASIVPGCGPSGSDG